MFVVGAGCSECARRDVTIGALEMRIVQLELANDVLQRELDEAVKLIELQQADLDRFEKAFKEHRPPNCPERAPGDELQLAMARVLEQHGEGLELPKLDDDEQDEQNGQDEPDSSDDDSG